MYVRRNESRSPSHRTTIQTVIVLEWLVEAKNTHTTTMATGRNQWHLHKKRQIQYQAGHRNQVISMLTDNKI